MVRYSIIIDDVVGEIIYSYYENVAKKYRYTYSYKNMDKNIKEVVYSMLRIENGLLRRKPIRPDWASKGWWMAYTGGKTKNWYFAYKIEGDTIYVMDACHGNNMANANLIRQDLQNEMARKVLAYIITERVMRKIKQLI